MHLLQAGVDMAVIALWLGHESIETAPIYVEAALAPKQRALDRLARCVDSTPTIPCWRSWPRFTALLSGMDHNNRSEPLK